MGPKYGVTHRQVLRAAGVPVDLAPAQAAARAGDPRIGWAYVDQKAVLSQAPRIGGPAHAHREAPGHHDGGGTGGAGTRPARDPPGHRLRAQALFAHLRAARAPRGLRLRAHRARRRGRRDPLALQTGKVFHYHERGEETSTEFKPAELGIEQTVRAPRIPGAAEADGRQEVRAVTPITPRSWPGRRPSRPGGARGRARPHARQPGLRRRALPVASRPPPVPARGRRRRARRHRRRPGARAPASDKLMGTFATPMRGAQAPRHNFA